MRQSSLLIIFFLFIFQAHSQTSFDRSYEFLNHLSEINAFREGVHFIDSNIDSYPSPGQRDTLNYLKGLFLYRQKLPDESLRSLSKVGDANGRFRTHALFLNAFQYAYLRDLDRADSVLNATAFEGGLNGELKTHELAGISLLRRDTEAFEKYTSYFSGQYFQLSQFQDQLVQNKEGLLKAKRKSPFLAGLMSGVVPGAGKFYVGKIGEGYTTLLLSAILGLQVREAYKKDGVSSLRFKLFASLFSTLYIANIWGSVLSVKIYKDDFNETFDEAILLNMHVPLRTIFK